MEDEEGISLTIALENPILEEADLVLDGVYNFEFGMGTREEVEKSFKEIDFLRRYLQKVRIDLKYRSKCI